jgi:glycosyltransferase involved in cell wall biosynthesis
MGEQGIGVKLGDVAAVADAMQRLQTDPGLCATFGASARARAETHFSHAATSRRTLDLIGGFLA